MNASVHGAFFSFYEDRILMKTAQIIFIFLLFILAMIVMTLPIWIDRALPIMKDSINSAGKTMEDMQASLAYIWERLSQDITRLLDKYVYGS
jgi:hypothetical protein